MLTAHNLGFLHYNPSHKTKKLVILSEREEPVLSLSKESLAVSPHAAETEMTRDSSLRSE